MSVARITLCAWLLVMATNMMTWSQETNITTTTDLTEQPITAEQTRFFEQHVRPLLVERCLECHGAESDSPGGQLRLDSRGGWQQGGDLGPAIVPGDAQSSLLLQAVRYTRDDLQMPPDGKLSAHDIQLLERWIAMGAPDPRVGNEIAPSAPRELRERNADEIEAGRSYWAFQSPHSQPIRLPAVRDATWPQSPVDRFILADLEQRGLHPVERASKRALIRRLTFDLLGLPPTPNEVQAFLADDRPHAYQQLVDRLLASPRYGERWGRFWLDVARYADSNGLDENIAYGNAWRYRDYVVNSWNEDKPYDHFVLEQLAGDLLTDETSTTTWRERIVATGFLSLGPKVLAEVDETKMEMDIIDEQVDTVGRALLALTMGCARCHDHKFDPLRTEDYYALAGIFKSTRTMEHFTKIARWYEVDISSDQLRKRRETQLAQITSLQQDLKELEAATTTSPADGSDSGTATTYQHGNRGADMSDALKARLTDLQQSLPEAEVAMAVADYPQPTDLAVHIRGSHLSQGKVVARGFPVVLSAAAGQSGTASIDGSGRLQLARWLVSGQHPLVARVIANRIWRWHFGRGLVATTDNFGKLGTPPRNQQLLDWLAQSLVNNNWSIKQLHRQILLSSVYQLSSHDSVANARLDPENRYQWRAEVRRLEAEAIRDALLAVSGRLDTTMGGSLLHVKDREFLFDHTSKDTTNYDSPRRSLYLPVIRNHLYDGFQLFDYTDASVTNSSRSTTVVAPQALFMMNSDLVLDCATAFASQLLATAADSTQQRIDQAYLRAFGRHAESKEVAAATEFLTQPVGPAVETDSAMTAWTMFCQAILMSNEFVHVR